MQAFPLRLHALLDVYIALTKRPASSGSSTPLHRAPHLLPLCICSGNAQT